MLTLEITIVNIKRIFGAVLTILGIGGLIYDAVLFVNTNVIIPVIQRHHSGAIGAT